MELDRCVGQMKLGKKPGVDEFPVEALKFSGFFFRRQVFQVVKEMWRRASAAPPSEEGRGWPAAWKLGLVAPLWKGKGSRRDK
eukprot:7659918-Pyramimonas_sp.AAC.1